MSKRSKELDAIVDRLNTKIKSSDVAKATTKLILFNLENSIPLPTVSEGMEEGQIEMEWHGNGIYCYVVLDADGDVADGVGWHTQRVEITDDQNVMDFVDYIFTGKESND